MEVKVFLSTLGLILVLTACSNTPELETGEIKTLKMITNAIDQIDRPQSFVDSKKLITRKKIDSANLPVLFVVSSLIIPVYSLITSADLPTALLTHGIILSIVFLFL